MDDSVEGTATEGLVALLERTEAAGVNHIAFSRDGSMMAVARTDMTIELFIGGHRVRTFDLASHNEKVRPTQRIRGVAFGSNGDRLFVASADQLRCMALGPDAPSWSVEPPRSFGFLVTSPLAIAVSGRDFVAATFDNGSLGIWSPEGQKVFFRRESNAPRTIDFAQEDSIAIGTDGFSLCSWDALRGKPQLKKMIGERSFYSVAWPQGNLVAVRTIWSVIVMDLRDGSVKWRVPTGVGLPKLAYEARTGRLAVPEEHSIIVLDVEGKELFRRSLLGGALTSVAFDPATGDVVVGKADGTTEFIACPSS